MTITLQTEFEEVKETWLLVADADESTEKEKEGDDFDDFNEDDFDDEFDDDFDEDDEEVIGDDQFDELE